MSFIKSRRAMSMVGYAMIVALIAGFSIFAVTDLGDSTRRIFASIAQDRPFTPHNPGGSGSGGGSGETPPGDSAGSDNPGAPGPVVFEIAMLPSYDAQVSAPLVIPVITEQPLPETGSFSAAGDLPPGLVVDPLTGTISGTPISSGAFVMQIVMASPEGRGESNPFTVDIEPAPAIASLGPFTFAVGEIVMIIPQAARAAAPASWSITPALPEGLEIDEMSGLISGTPLVATATGSHTLSLLAANGASASRSLSLTVTETAFTLTIDPELYVAQGAAVSRAIASSGGVAPIAFTLDVSSGPLPAGVTLSEAGLLSGVATQAGVFEDIVVRATDATGRVSLSQPFTIVVFGERTANLAGPEIAVQGSESSRKNLEELYDGLTGSAANVYSEITSSVVLRFSTPVVASGAYISLRNDSSSVRTITAQALVNGNWVQVYSASVSGSNSINAYVPFSTGSLSASQFRIFASAGSVRLREFRIGFNDQAPIGPSWTTPEGYVGRTGETVQLQAAKAPNAWIAEPLRFALAPGSSLPSGTTLQTNGVLSIGPFAADNHEFTVRVFDGVGGASVDRVFRISASRPYADVTGAETAQQGTASSRTNLEELYDGDTSTNVYQETTSAVVVRYSVPVIASGMHLSMRNDSSAVRTITVQAHVNGTWRTIYTDAVSGGNGVNGYIPFPNGAVASREFRFLSNGASTRLREFRLGYGGRAPRHPTWDTPAGYLGRAGESVDLLATKRNPWISQPLHFELAPGSSLPTGTTLTSSGTLTIGNFAADNHEFVVRAADGRGGPSLERAFRIASFKPRAHVTGPETSLLGSVASREALEELYDGNTLTNVYSETSAGVTVRFDSPVIASGVQAAIRNDSSSLRTVTIQALVNGAWRTVWSDMMSGSSTINSYLAFPNGGVAARDFRFVSNGTMTRLREFRLGFDGRAPRHPTWTSPAGYVARAGETVTLAATSNNPYLNGPIHYALAPDQSLPAGTTLQSSGVLSLVSNIGIDNHEFVVRAADREGGASLERRFRITQNYPYASLVMPETAIQGTSESRASLEALYDGVTSTNVYTDTTSPVVVRFLSPVIASGVQAAIRNDSSSLRTVTIQALVNGAWRTVWTDTMSGSSTINSYLAFEDGGVAASEFRMFSSGVSVRLREFRLGFAEQSPIHQP